VVVRAHDHALADAGEHRGELLVGGIRHHAVVIAAQRGVDDQQVGQIGQGQAQLPLRDRAALVVGELRRPLHRREPLGRPLWRGAGGAVVRDVALVVAAQNRAAQPLGQTPARG